MSRTVVSLPRRAALLAMVLVTAWPVWALGQQPKHLPLTRGERVDQAGVGGRGGGGGTKIGLVALDLPSGLSNHDHKDSD